MKRQTNEQKPVKKQHVKSKKTYTYAEAHNRAFWAFNKATRVMIWASVFNVIGIMMAIITANFGTVSQPPSFREASFFYEHLVRSAYEFPLCYSICSLIFRFLELPPAGTLGGSFLPFPAYLTIIVVIGIIFSALTVWISVQSSLGKKWALYTQTIFYLVDTGLLIALHLLGEYGQVIWIMFGIHVLILGFLAISIYQYYKILTIEKVYKNSMTQNPEAYARKTKTGFNMMANQKSKQQVDNKIDETTNKGEK